MANLVESIENNKGLKAFFFFEGGTKDFLECEIMLSLTEIGEKNQV